MNNKLHVIFFLILFQCSAYAEQDQQKFTLTIDEPIAETTDLKFPEDKILLPETGEFKIISTILMSNPSGERWATVTIKNLSSYQRLLDKEHIVAMFANGERRYPVQAKYKFDGKETTTMVINFGKNTFPVLRLIVRN